MSASPAEAHHALASQHRAHQGSFRMAAVATLHCLTGCAIGEVLGLAIGTALGLGDAVTISLAITLAFLFGYSLTLVSLRRAGLALAVAVPFALASDTLSITVMEIVDNVAMVTIPGAMDAGLGDWLFWGALASALAVAFVVALPVNAYLIARGRGHAAIHRWHEGGAAGADGPPPPLARARLALIAAAALAFTLAVGVTAALVAADRDDDAVHSSARPPSSGDIGGL